MKTYRQFLLEQGEDLGRVAIAGDEAMLQQKQEGDEQGDLLNKIMRKIYGIDKDGVLNFIRRYRDDDDEVAEMLNKLMKNRNATMGEDPYPPDRKPSKPFAGKDAAMLNAADDAGAGG